MSVIKHMVMGMMLCQTTPSAKLMLQVWISIKISLFFDWSKIWCTCGKTTLLMSNLFIMLPCIHASYICVSISIALHVGFSHTHKSSCTKECISFSLIEDWLSVIIEWTLISLYSIISKFLN